MLAAPKVKSCIKLRPYQADAEQQIYSAWASPGVSNVLAVLPTGAGKTVTFANILAANEGPAIAIAHRQELVSQISLALARNGVEHSIVGPPKVHKLCTRLHLKNLNRNFVKPNKPIKVGGVDTLIKRQKELAAWAASVTLWVQDEAHHVLGANKWGVACNMFPNAKGLGVTATPTRADGKGLGRHADGVFDRMVEGPGMRELIDLGYLTDYRIIGVKTEGYDRAAIKIGASGEMTKGSIKKELLGSKIVGDVVKHYSRHARGKLGVTFADSVDTARAIAEKFNSAGIPAAVLHGGSSDEERFGVLEAYKKREILQLVNVDLFGEGFDLPAIEVVSFARPTQSLSLFIQQFGRGLRLMIDKEYTDNWDDYTPVERRQIIAASSKPRAIIIDHVGNLVHGLPDAFRPWTLDRRERRGRGAANDDVIPTRACLNPSCLSVYERVKPVCPYCGFEPVRAEKSGPEFVDGDLSELDPKVLEAMRGDIKKVDQSLEDYERALTIRKCPRNGTERNLANHAKRQRYQAALRRSIEWWAGFLRARGMCDREINRRFWFAFGLDTMTAQTLGPADALILADKINTKLTELVKHACN